MRKPLRAVVLGLGITTSGWAQIAAPAEKPKAPPAKAVAPRTNEPSQPRITIDGPGEVESLKVQGEFPGTLELNNITVNDLILLIEKLRFEEEALDTYVIREEAGKVKLPRIVTQKKGLKEILENLPSVEPKLGVEQLPNGGYVILSREKATPAEEKTFAAFGLKEYLNRLPGDPKEVDNKAKEERSERAIVEIQKLIEDAFELQGITQEKSASQVSIRIHQSTGVLLATGTPKQLTVIRTTLQALGIPGSVSGGPQDWAPRYVPGTPGAGGMMGGGMGGGAMGSGFGSMGSGGGWGPAVAPNPMVVPPGGGFEPALPLLPSNAARPATPIPPGASTPAKPAAPPMKPGYRTPEPATTANPQVVSPNRP